MSSPRYPWLHIGTLLILHDEAPGNKTRDEDADLETCAAAHVDLIMKNHPFVDGNRQAA